MTKIAKIRYNDISNGDGVCVSLFVQGCPHHCIGCFNQETWDPEGGQEIPIDIKGQLIKAISANGINRNFNVLGGEPLVEYNLDFIQEIIQAIRTAYPNIKIFLWTGYTIDELKERAKTEIQISKILEMIDVLIEGRFKLEERDITLQLRGSRNQRILYKNIDF